MRSNDRQLRSVRISGMGFGELRLGINLVSDKSPLDFTPKFSSSFGEGIEPRMNLRNLASRPITSVALTILVCLGISACQPIPPLTCQITSPPKTEEKRTDKIVASLYVDATESMRGFVTIGSTTRYARILEAIEGAISTGWNAQFERYLFGTKVSDNIPKSSFKPMQASFYKSGTTPGFEYNEIDKAVIHSTPGKDRLAIIITDLYQRDADINAILKPLSEKYLRAGYAIGIVAIKSEFIGTIYDVGSEKSLALLEWL